MASSTTIDCPHDPYAVEIEVRTHTGLMWIRALIEGNEVSFMLPRTASLGAAEDAADALRKCYAPNPTADKTSASRFAEVA